MGIISIPLLILIILLILGGIAYRVYGAKKGKDKNDKNYR